MIKICRKRAKRGYVGSTAVGGARAPPAPPLAPSPQGEGGRTPTETEQRLGQIFLAPLALQRARETLSRWPNLSEEGEGWPWPGTSSGRRELHRGGDIRADAPRGRTFFFTGRIG